MQGQDGAYVWYDDAVHVYNVITYVKGNGKCGILRAVKYTPGPEHFHARIVSTSILKTGELCS